jgi:hypothetical protein
MSLMKAERHFYTTFSQEVRNENGGLALYTRGTPIAGRGYAMARAGVQGGHVGSGADWPAADHPGQDAIYV